MSKVIHVEFHTPIDGKQHYYFGSKSAIYEKFSTDIVGISLNSLRNNYNLSISPYFNNKCKIYQGELIRKENTRKNRD